MRLIKCIFTESDCFKNGSTIVPTGVMWHSTGANNPNAKRYAQPSDNDENRVELYAAIGINRNQNDWNRPGVNKCVHAFIGKVADGNVATVKCLPWNYRGWHAGTGTKGQSANNTHISFEVCEDDLTDEDYFNKVYREGKELTAMLCAENNLDPMVPGVVISHHEGAEMGIASNHSDIDHWLSRFGKTMDDVRRDVKEAMENDMDQEQFDVLMDNYLARRATIPPAAWSGTAREWAESVGLIVGNEKGEKMYNSWVTREQLMQFLYRLKNEL